MGLLNRNLFELKIPQLKGNEWKPIYKIIVNGYLIIIFRDIFKADQVIMILESIVYEWGLASVARRGRSTQVVKKEILPVQTF